MSKSESRIYLGGTSVKNLGERMLQNQGGKIFV